MKKIIAYLLSIVFLYFIIYMSFSKMELKKANNSFVNNLFRTANYYLYPYEMDNKYFYSFINFINNIKLNQPLSIVEKTFYRTSNYNIEFGYIQNDIVSKPKVFIYTTHYNEGYIDNKTILEAAYLLQTKLNELGVMTIVSERSVIDYLNNNNLTYKDSYLATREFVKDALDEYDTLELIIDLHRDAVSRETSTASVDGVDYAKIMFVMNENYPNVELANKLNDIVLSKASITRGIYPKRVDNFNQDLSNNVILIEMGGNYNNFSEVENSTNILAESIKELINEEY